MIRFRAVRRECRALPLVLMLFALAGCGKEEARPEQAHPVRVTAAVLSDQRLHASYSGDVRARYETDLGFRVGGKILARQAEVGSAVKSGEVLARLDPQDLQLNVLSARSQLEAARSDYEQARADLERYRNLLKKRFISEAEFDRRENQYRVAKAKLEQAHAQVGVAQNQGAYATLRSDGDGVITAILAEAGQVVAAGQTVMRMARGDEREVVISVPENRLGELKAANDIRVHLWADPSVSYKGKVREVSPGADPVTRTYTVKISVLDTDPRVRLGMTANVLLGSTLAEQAIELPLTALYRKEGGAAVWVVDAATGTVKLVPVRLGEYHENTFTVLDGLKAGDLVVTAGVHKLIPGQKVKFPSQSPS
jgi:RND family efflux transporter MFP subunit